MSTIIELVRDVQLMNEVEGNLRNYLRNNNCITTVIIPSEVVNKQTISLLFKSINRDIQVLFNVPDKPTVEAVKELCELPDSEFWNYYKEGNIGEKFQILYYWFKRMKVDCNGFYYHSKIADKDVKNAVKKTLEAFYYNLEEIENADNLINGKEILIIDKDTYNIDYLVECLETKYKPLSIKQIKTVLPEIILW